MLGNPKKLRHITQVKRNMSSTDMNEQFANAFADVQNLETLANVSAQAASLPNDEVQDVLDSCILESTKIKHVNQAILYFKFAFDRFCSENKKHLNEDFFNQIIINQLREAVRKKFRNC